LHYHRARERRCSRACPTGVSVDRTRGLTITCQVDLDRLDPKRAAPAIQAAN
jgi:hypothetical protein